MGSLQVRNGHRGLADLRERSHETLSPTPPAVKVAAADGSRRHRTELGNRLGAYKRFGGQDLLDIDELATAWAENSTNITEDYALQLIADVDQLVTSHNVRTGNNVG